MEQELFSVRDVILRSNLCPSSKIASNLMFSTSTCSNSLILCPISAMKTQENVAAKTAEWKFFDSIHEVPAHLWDHSIPTSKLFLHRLYLTAFEEAHKETVDVRFVVLLKEGQAVAWAFLPLVRIEQSNLQLEEKNGKWINNVGVSVKNSVRNWVNNMNVRMLICGNPFITGQHGFYFSEADINGVEAFAQLSNAIDTIVKTEKGRKDPITAIMVKEFEGEMLKYGQELTKNGYKEVEGLPDMILYLREEWYCFEDYLQSMTSKYRVRTKKYRKNGKKLERRDLSLEEIEANKAKIYQLYRAIADKAEINLLCATSQYYVELKRQFGNQFKILGYYLEGELVGFISYFVTETHLEAHYVGYEYALNRKHGLYANILYDLVNEAIKYRVKTLAFGRTAHEIKSTVGAEPITASSFMRHEGVIGNRILVPIINRLREDSWEQRRPFKQEGLTQKK